MANWTIMNESPKALGTVQIIIGAVVFLFGFVLKSVSDSEIIINSVNSNIIYWGSFSFIISGALSVASLDTSHPSLVKAALAMNVVSLAIASAGVRVFSDDLQKSPEYHCSHIFYQRELALIFCRFFWKHTIGNSKVLLGFSVLEIIVSIATFVLTWKVRSSTETTSAAVPHST
ncbi:membrane-spanning 4-domains subfamily A member 15-like isoform X1 [Silurus meridionalis]|uniref:Uncharacterized protein n=1 Tax=Silurus meridionalis TaxID=175797 RepID=A0A8T0BUT4_SILME|nr:membrane-spanning 4-domains subfamily A member 15-like isoform X1 [Silurus meridionalis]KAF7711061.1 hypothetical protein HF521_000072 [Silurus meridionalis]